MFWSPGGVESLPMVMISAGTYRERPGQAHQSLRSWRTLPHDFDPGGQRHHPTARIPDKPVKISGL